MIPMERSARGRTEAAPEVAEPSTQQTVEVTQSGPVTEPDTGHLGVAASGTRMHFAGEPMETRVPHVLPASDPADMRSTPRSRPSPFRSTARPRLVAQPQPPTWRFARQLLRRQAATVSR
jgi:hypothetical protein